MAQLHGMALVGGADEAESSNGPATSAIFALMKAYSYMEGVVNHMDIALHRASVVRREMQEGFDTELDRTTEQLMQMTASRDQVVQRETAATQEILVQGQIGGLVTTIANYQQVLDIVLQQQNEAWNVEVDLIVISCLCWRAI